jgi:hypothetical protein
MHVSALRRPGIAFLFVAAALLAVLALFSLSSNNSAQASHADYSPTANESGAGPANCNDNIDNDGDTLIDAQDPQCHPGNEIPANWPKFDALFDTRLCNLLPANFATGLSAYFAVLNGAGPTCAQVGTASGNPDLGAFFSVPVGSENFAQDYFATSVAGFTLAASGTIPVGSLMGGLASNVALGLGPGSECTPLGAAVKFAFYKGTDASDDPDGNGVPTNVVVAAAEGTEDRFDSLAAFEAATIASNTAPAVTAFPDMTLRFLDPDGDGIDTDGNPATLNDQPVLPVARYVGLTRVPAPTGAFQILQLMTFAAGDLASRFNSRPGIQAHPLAKLGSAIGPVTVTLLNDPTATTISPNFIVDFCSPLGTQSTILGMAYNIDGSEDGAGPGTCSDGIDNPGGDALVDFNDPDCRIARITAPAAAGSYYAQVLTQTIRDTDDDGLDNGYDSCQTIDNIDDPYPGFDGNGGDDDSYDPACDPTPATNTAGVVQCEGEAVPTGHAGDHDGDCYPNPQDPCPATKNNPPGATPPGTGEKDSENDATRNASAWDGGPHGDVIGDTCDTDDIVSNGGFFQARSVDSVCITNADADDDGWCEAQDWPASGADAALNIIDGRIDCQNSGAIDAADDCDFQTYNPGAGGDGVIDGEIDCNDDGAITAADDCTVLLFITASTAYKTRNVIDGRIDVNNDGATTATDDASIAANRVGGATGGASDHNTRSTQTTDPDGDGFNTNVEIQIGTDPLSRCSQLTGHDAWPADLVPSNSINISDVGQVLPPSFGSTPAGAGAYTTRKDLVPGGTAASSAINISDVGKVLPPTFGKTCTP